MSYSKNYIALAIVAACRLAVAVVRCRLPPRHRRSPPSPAAFAAARRPLPPFAACRPEPRLSSGAARHRRSPPFTTVATVHRCQPSSLVPRRRRPTPALRHCRP